MSCQGSSILRCSIKVRGASFPVSHPHSPSTHVIPLLSFPAHLHLLYYYLSPSSLEMLSSLKSHEEEGDNPHHHHPYLLLPSSSHARQLLLASAELVHRADDVPAARRALSILLSAASPVGDATDRLVHQFTRALSLRLDRLCLSTDPEALQSSYLSLNQVTPFVRFAHLTANQAILEAIDGRRSIHILDFDTTHGVQWPPLLQAIADHSDPNDPPSIRITGTGNDASVLHRTGERLGSFAQSVGLRFQFHPLSSTSFNLASLELVRGETLVVNCVLYLHKLLREGDEGMRELMGFLHGVRRMTPAVVTVAEREAGYGGSQGGFMQRFVAAVDYYAAVFESLEATLPPASRERVAVEQGWLGREIAGVVAGGERWEGYERWEAAMRRAGFEPRPLSGFAVSQARLLLRLHYPSEGYQLQSIRDSFFLGWQNRPLFSVSSWH